MSEAVPQQRDACGGLSAENVSDAGVMQVWGNCCFLGSVKLEEGKKGKWEMTDRQAAAAAAGNALCRFLGVTCSLNCMHDIIMRCRKGCGGLAIE